MRSGRLIVGAGTRAAAFFMARENCANLPRCQSYGTIRDEKWTNQSRTSYRKPLPCLPVRGQSPAAERASWRAAWARAVRRDETARDGAWRENWGSPFRFLRSIFLRSCPRGFQKEFCAFLRAFSG